jgi:hypothetical protein
LTPIKEEVELPPFRTTAEIVALMARGGLSDAESSNLWDCLYLMPLEIAQLLTTVRNRAERDSSHLLHAIPAYDYGAPGGYRLAIAQPDRITAIVV